LNVRYNAELKYRPSDPGEWTCCRRWYCWIPIHGEIEKSGSKFQRKVFCSNRRCSICCKTIPKVLSMQGRRHTELGIPCVPTSLILPIGKSTKIHSFKSGTQKSVPWNRVAFREYLPIRHLHKSVLTIFVFENNYGHIPEWK